MVIDIDLAAIVIMEFFGAVSFLVAFLFFRQRLRIKKLQREYIDALNRRMISERGDGKCFSSEWVMDNIVYRPKKLLSATPLLLLTVTLSLSVLFYVIGPHFFVGVVGFGYTSVITLLAVSVLLWTDAFEAYGYTNAIHGVPVKKLDKEDRSYIDLAAEALIKACLRFISLGIAFAVFGPFVPQIFDGVVFGLVLYSTIFFQASDVLFKTFTILGFLVVFALPGIMLFLPELLWRIMIRKVMPLTKKHVMRRKG